MKDITPYLAYSILQIAVMIIGFNIVREDEYGFSGLIKSWVMGQMLLFGILQFLAVPMIFLRCQFSVLFWIYIGIAISLFGCGIKRIKLIKIRKTTMTPMAAIFLILTCLLITSQITIYIYGVHLDQDDARWLAEANDALTYGDMFTRSYDTGEYIGFFQAGRDAVSPWPMMIAIVSRILQTNVSIFAHSVYPAVELILVYCIYWLIAHELFQKKEAQLSFVFLAGIVILFYGKTVYNQGTFTLVRIWQGKASVAAVIIPVLYYQFIRINKNDELRDWFQVTIIGAAACLMSGMGIAISVVMIGAFGIYNIIAYQRWKKTPIWIVSLIPSIISFMAYRYIGG